MARDKSLMVSTNGGEPIAEAEEALPYAKLLQQLRVLVDELSEEQLDAAFGGDLFQAEEEASEEEAGAEVQPESDGIACIPDDRGSWVLRSMLPEDGVFFDASEENYNRRAWTVHPQCYDNESSKIAELLEEWGVGAVNMKGCKGEGDTNFAQDELCIAHLGDEWLALCVFDGHGLQGHWPARRAARTFPFLLKCEPIFDLLKSGRVDLALRQVFQFAQQDLEIAAEHQGVDLLNAGCTATVALLDPTREFVWVAYVGDSRAVIINPGRQQADEMTADHRLDRDDEQARIKSMGGEVDTKTFADGFVERRVYVRGEKFPGLNLTRSLGDLHGKAVGVVGQPEIVKWSLKDKQGAYLLLCTDGVWEHLATRSAVDLVLNTLSADASAQTAVDVLLAEAIKAWSVPDKYCDDITIILAPLTSFDEPSNCDANPCDQFSAGLSQQPALGAGLPMSISPIKRRHPRFGCGMEISGCCEPGGRPGSLDVDTCTLQ